MEPPKKHFLLVKQRTILPWDKFSDFYKELQQDDIQSFERRLATCGKEQTLKGCFDLSQARDFYQQTRECCFQPKRPFTLAAIFGSFKILKCMLKNGVDTGALDWNQGNVLHCMISFAFFYPHKEPLMCSVFQLLDRSLDRNRMKSLLIQENNLGLRPVEMAAQLGTFGLFHCIFETKEIYLIKAEIHGLFCYKLYDITEYESVTEHNRFMLSPMHFLAHMDQNKLSDPQTAAMMTWTMVRNWTHGKWQQNSLLVCLWFLFRLFFTVLYQVFSISHASEELLQAQPNSTSCTVSVRLSQWEHKMVAFLLITMASLVIVLDVYEAIWWNWKRYVFWQRSCCSCLY